MIDINEYSYEFKKLEEQFNKISEYFNLDIKTKKLSEFESKILEENFWDNPKNSSKVLKEKKILETNLNEFNNLKSNITAFKENIEILKDSSNLDIELKELIEEDVKNLFKNIKKELVRIEELELLGNSESMNAIVTIHAGAGGTESCDWAQMLYRMYLRYANFENYSVEEVDMQLGDTAGIKSVTFIVRGEYASTKLESEMGVHRLVRISPFDSGSRRHTSFASVEVLPEIEELGDIEVKDEDLRIDTYRASGAGGQHVNKTESAVRIVHIPTNTVVTCQNERSQMKNRETAMKILKSKLYVIEEEKRKKELGLLKGEEKDIAWGSQIRSYVFCPYTLVKDHRTNCETGKVDNVMNGEISEFIHSYLVYKNMKSKD